MELERDNFSKGTKVSLHTVVLIRELFNHFGKSNSLGNNYLRKAN